LVWHRWAPNSFGIVDGRVRKEGKRFRGAEKQVEGAAKETKGGVLGVSFLPIYDGTKGGKSRALSPWEEKGEP